MRALRRNPQPLSPQPVNSGPRSVREASLEGTIAAERRRSADLVGSFHAFTDRVVADMTSDYYRAMARSLEQSSVQPYNQAVDENSRLNGKREDAFGAAHLGVMQHCVDVLSRMLNRDTITLTYRLDHGIPLGPDGDQWIALNDVDTPGVTGDVLLYLPDGTTLPARDRLDQLMRDNLNLPPSAYRRR